MSQNPARTDASLLPSAAPMDRAGMPPIVDPGSTPFTTAAFAPDRRPGTDSHRPKSRPRRDRHAILDRREAQFHAQAA